MQDLLSHPAFQSAAAPLVVGVLVALIGLPVRLSGLAALAGFAVCVHLATGLSILPLSAARKIVAVAFAGAIAGMLLDFLSAHTARARAIVLAAAAAAIVWVLWTALSNRELAEALKLGAGLAVYCAIVAWAFDRLQAQPMRAGSAALSMGLGGGAAIILGTSALLGQMSLAVASASGGYLLVQMSRGRTITCGRTFTFATSLVLALTSAAAVVLATLPWYVLPILALAPLAASLPFGDRMRVWQQAIAFSVVAMVPAAAAAFAAWQAANSG